MKCNLCETNIEESCFDIGNTPISNDLLLKEDLSLPELTYPLVLYICPKCFLAQTAQYKKGFEVFSDNYVYFSSYSSYWLKHARKYVKNIIKRLNLNKSSFVLEVASNDGYLLTNFLDYDITCLGIEPTKSTAMEAIKKGVPTIIDFFNLELVDRIIKDNKKADLVVANNVLAHVPDINDFISSLKKILEVEGTITIEFPHLLNLVELNQFDTIYHEHFYYFSILNLSNALNKYNLSIYDIEELETHGGSIRAFITHANNKTDQNNKKNVNTVLKREISYGMNSLEYYKKIVAKSFDVKLKALEYLINKKMEGKKIIAFGAAAKGNTFLNYCGIKRDLIDVVIDETPHKIGKYLPQSKIPIVQFSAIEELKPNIIIILPWNHKSEILEKLSFTKQWDCEIVVFIPKLEVL